MRSLGFLLWKSLVRLISVQTIFKFKVRIVNYIFDVFFETGFDTEGLSSAVWPGGETEALTRLERHLERKVDKILLLSIFKRVKNI